MRKVILITVLGFLGQGVNAQVKVLYLGNSYTGANDLPQMITNVALSTGDVIDYDRNTIGGATLAVHTNNATSLNKIQSEEWDYVVLQAQSQEPSFPIQQVESGTFPFAEQLTDLIRDNHACSIPIFYMTWGRENGDASNCSFWPPVCTYEGMDDLLNERYRTMANDNDSYISPVGAVWRYIRENHPNIDLYANDGSHPSAAGSYAAACTFYSIILQKDPTFITFDHTLNASDANIIKDAAKIVAFDDLMEWNVGNFDPLAQFSFTQMGNVLSFQNNSMNYDSLSWNFGDGSFSSLVDPVHHFGGTNNTYQITLQAHSCRRVDESTITIQVPGTNPCPPNYTFSGNGGLSGILTGVYDFETDGWIESNQQIGPSSSIDYDSQIGIHLLNDFEVPMGVNFLAFINGCNGGLGGFNINTNESITK